MAVTRQPSDEPPDGRRCSGVLRVFLPFPWKGLEQRGVVDTVA